MPPRPSLPADDLYARLELPTNATPEAIEIAWRALLRRHHPDVAGPDGLERAKRINVAHDWLSDPDLRARYDRERHLHRSNAAGTATPWRHASGPARRAPADTSAARNSRRPVDIIGTFLDRVAALTADDIDRLDLADPAPIAFGATIRRFLPDELRATLEAIEADIERRLPPAARRPAIRDSVRAHAAELVLGPFLDELLSEPFRSRTRERLSRGWEAAVNQPRYGPNGSAVRELISRLSGLDAAAISALAHSGTRAGLGEEPWPPGTSPEDDEGLRVSSALGGRDAAAAIDAAAARAPTHQSEIVLARARRAAARLAHLLVLRHAFAPATFDALAAPWRPTFVSRDPARPDVRRPSPS
jgi:molecular chaperone DnaJ